jgi:hypothetical protein
MSVFCLSLQFLFPCSRLAQVVDIFQSLWVNCIVLAISFLLIALGLSELIDFFYRKSVSMRWRRSKLGEILVSEGYITDREVKDVLSEQRFRIGEVLLEAGRITAQQLNQAPDYQKKVSKKKLGEILKKLGHSTEEDINWALDRMERTLGEILRERGIVTDHELHRVWSLQRSLWTTIDIKRSEEVNCYSLIGPFWSVAYASRYKH